MKLRHLIAIFSVVCLTLAGLLGVVHDHADKDGWTEVHHCSACHWQTAATGDVPVCTVLPLVQIVVLQPVLTPANAPVVAPFFSPTAGRAPPELV